MFSVYLEYSLCSVKFLEFSKSREKNSIFWCSDRGTTGGLSDLDPSRRRRDRPADSSSTDSILALRKDSEVGVQVLSLRRPICYPCSSAEIRSRHQATINFSDR